MCLLLVACAVVDALVEVASQMKALEAQVSALSTSRQGSLTPISTPGPSSNPCDSNRAAAAVASKTNTSRAGDSGAAGSLVNANAGVTVCGRAGETAGSSKLAASAADAAVTEHGINRGGKAGPGDPTSVPTFIKPVAGPLMDTQATGEQQPSTSAPALAKVAQAGYTSEPDLAALVAQQGRVVPGTAPASREVPSMVAPSTGHQGSIGRTIATPDLMTFSPAVSTRPSGLQQQPEALPSQPVSLLQQTQQTAPQASSNLMHSVPVLSPQLQQQQQSRVSQSSALGLALGQQQATAMQLHQLEPSAVQVFTGMQTHPEQSHAKQSHPEQSHALDMTSNSRAASPLAGGSFYDNAVFGSPTPTPSPQQGLLNTEHSLLSPGSSPRPQQLSRAAQAGASTLLNATWC